MFAPVIRVLYLRPKLRQAESLHTLQKFCNVISWKPKTSVPLLHRLINILRNALIIGLTSYRKIVMYATRSRRRLATVVLRGFLGQLFGSEVS